MKTIYKVCVIAAVFGCMTSLSFAQTRSVTLYPKPAPAVCSEIKTTAGPMGIMSAEAATMKKETKVQMIPVPQPIVMTPSAIAAPIKKQGN